MIPFQKYHGLGNDFVFVHESDVQEMNLSELAILMCDRHTGIGADGLIIVEEQPLTMTYYNSDGSRAKMCGNGIRCFANYCVDNNIVDTFTFTVQTLAGTYQIEVLDTENFTCQVNMGKPDFTASNIPINTTQDTFINQNVEVQDKRFTLTSLFMGTIHTTVEVEELVDEDIVFYGQQIQQLECYPDSTNVNFYTILDDENIAIKTYERGAGLTLACGTGATAVYSVLHTLQQQTKPITFHLPLGTMTLHADEFGDMIMTGPATFVFAGRWE